jgi:DNA helicase-2/ATP-dependent DNA helicase PcrA
VQEAKPAAPGELSIGQAADNRAGPARTGSRVDSGPHPGLKRGMRLFSAGLKEGAEALCARARALLEDGCAPESILMVATDAAALQALRARLAAAGGVRPRALCAPALALELIAVANAPARSAAQVRLASRQARLALLAQVVQKAAPERSSSERARRLRALARELERIDLQSANRPNAQRAEQPGPCAVVGANGAPADDPLWIAALHDAILEERGLLSEWQALWKAAELLQSAEQVREALAARHRHLLVASSPDLPPAGQALLVALARAPVEITIAAPERAAQRLRAIAAQAIARPEDRSREQASGGARSSPGAPRSAPAFVLCADQRAQARSIAAAVEAQLVRSPHCRVAIAMPRLEHEGRVLAGALRARHLPFLVPYAPESFAPAAVRDLLAWLRLLLDPHAGEAGMRLLLRPPALPAAEVAQIGRLMQARRLDLAGAAQAVAQAQQCSRTARERILAFLDRYRALTQELAERASWELLPALIWHAGLRESADLNADLPSGFVAGALLGLEALAQELAELRPEADARAIARDLLRIADSGAPLLDAQSDPSAIGELFLPEHCAGAALLLAAEQHWPHPLDLVIIVAGQGCALYARAPDGRPEQSDERDQLRRERAEPPLRAGEAGTLERWLELADERALIFAAEPPIASAGREGDVAVEELRRRLGASWEVADQSAPGPPQPLAELMRAARTTLIEELEAVGEHLGELRLDSEQEIAAGLGNALAYMKLAALRALPKGADPREHVEDLDARLLRSASEQQREHFAGSALARMLAQRMPELLAPGAQPVGEHERSLRAAERSLAALLPRRGEGLSLSASDLDSFRICPLRYKFARVLRLPRRQTAEQRFGIAVHRALERFHARFAGDRRGAQAPEGAIAIERYLADSWRRAGLSGADPGLYALARDALLSHQRSLAARAGAALWLERRFAIQVGAHTLSGRVDRVDRLDEDHYEIIDYKTSRARPLDQLEEELQLEIYGLAAQQSWGCKEVTLTYDFIIDGTTVRLPPRSAKERKERIERALEQVAEELLALRFTPRPSFAACSTCDFLTVCPAVES